MKCDNCGAIIKEDECYEYAGRNLCEDCYLDIKATPKTCDPWAVYSAKRLSQKEQKLTPIQEKILSLIKEKGEITAEEICDQLNITKRDFEANFAPLRHLELAKATKKGNTIYYTLFE